MGINRMAGASWHVERVHRKDGDLRRNKKRCKYYENGSCEKYIRCIGSAHCMKYKEKKDNAKKINKNSSSLNRENKKKVIVLIEPINSVETKIFNSLKEKRSFKFRRFFENFIKYHDYDECDIKMAFVRMENCVYLCKYKYEKLQVIKSNSIVTVSFDIVELNEKTDFNENHYSLVGVGHDKYTGEIRVLRENS